MLSKKDTCFTIGTLLITSPVRRDSTPTAIESRLLVGIEPSSAKRRGATKRRWRPSLDNSRIATSSCLQPNSWLTAFTTRSPMSSSSSWRSLILSFWPSMACKISWSSRILCPT